MTAGWNTARPAASLHSAPNMTPLVDVVMVLLIFLMLAGSFGGIERYLSHNLAVRPGGSGAVFTRTSALPPVTITIAIDAAPNVPFAASINGTRVASPQALTTRLAALHDQLAATGGDAQIRISAGRAAGYRHVLAAYESAAAAQFTKVALINVKR